MRVAALAVCLIGTCIFSCDGSPPPNNPYINNYGDDGGPCYSPPTTGQGCLAAGGACYLRNDISACPTFWKDLGSLDCNGTCEGPGSECCVKEECDAAPLPPTCLDDCVLSLNGACACPAGEEHISWCGYSPCCPPGIFDAGASDVPEGGAPALDAADSSSDVNSN